VCSSDLPELSDTVTMYHPDDGTGAAWRNVVDIVRLQNIIQAIADAFEGERWRGVAIVPDSQAIVSDAARKPLDARARLSAVIDSLGSDALLSNVATSKDTITATPSTVDPNRMDLGVTVFLSSNASTISIDLNFRLNTNG